MPSPDPSPSPNPPAGILRIALAVEQFWPYADTTARVIGDWANQLRQRGHFVRIVTTRWGRDWPDRFEYRQIPVDRIARMGTGNWSGFRCGREFSRYFAQHQWDATVLTGLGPITQAILKGAPDATRRLIYVNRPLLGEPMPTTLRRRITEWIDRTCGLITDCPVVANELRSSIQPGQIHDIGMGTEIKPVSRTLAVQSAARAALSEAHPVMAIDAGQPLVVTGIELVRDSGVLDLIHAWSQVVRRIPRARLWILGDGPLGPVLWRRIQELDLTHSVILPGYFDDDREIFLAADLYVHPARQPDASHGLIRALEAQTSIIATRTDWTESFLNDGDSAWLVPLEDPLRLALAIEEGLAQGDYRFRLARRARDIAVEHFDVSQQIDKMLRLLEIPLDETCEPAT